MYSVVKGSVGGCFVFVVFQGDRASSVVQILLGGGVAGHLTQSLPYRCSVQVLFQWPRDLYYYSGLVTSDVYGTPVSTAVSIIFTNTFRSKRSDRPNRMTPIGVLVAEHSLHCRQHPLSCSASALVAVGHGQVQVVGCPPPSISLLLRCGLCGVSGWGNPSCRCTRTSCSRAWKYRRGRRG